MLLIVLSSVAGALVLAAGAWAGLVAAMRRPALAARLLRIRPLRALMARMAAAGVRASRRRARRDGTIAAGRPMSDLEAVLAFADTEEAAGARAMLARMSPRQRNELSRRTMGADGLGGLLAAGVAAGGEGSPLGRAARRAGATGAASPARDAARAARKRKAVAKRRAARAGARR
jgi:hypothetical protein